MSSSGYALFFTLAPFVYGIAAVLAGRRAGGRGVWTVWGVAAVVGCALGYLDWRLPPDEGVPLLFYICVAVIPTAAGAWAAVWATQRPMQVVLQVVMSGTITWVTVFPVLAVFTALA